MVFEAELKKLGLKDKEAAVYITCLQLGPSPVQQIARKANVVRATTYVVLESLMDRGLVTKYKEGKKTLFSGESPRQLMRLLEKSRDQIDEKQRDLEILLPELQVLVKAAAGRPSVRYFAGLEGLRSMRREMAMYSQPGDTWHNFTPMDHLEAVFGVSELLYNKQRVAKGILAKTIFTTKSSSLKKRLLEGSRADLSERRFVKPDLFSNESGMTIFRDRVAIGSFTGRVGGVVIESEQMANMMRSFFELAWSGINR